MIGVEVPAVAESRNATNAALPAPAMRYCVEAVSPDFYKQVESDMIDYTKTILQIYHIGEQFGQKDLCKQLDLRWTEAVGYGLDVYLKN